jgi:hypothetical protein
MKFVKNKIFKKAAPFVFAALVAVLTVTMLLPGKSTAQLPPLPNLDPAAVRVAVLEMGMDSLSKVVLTDPATLLLYVRGTPPVADVTTDPPTPAPPAALTNYATASQCRGRPS